MAKTTTPAARPARRPAARPATDSTIHTERPAARQPARVAAALPSTSSVSGPLDRTAQALDRDVHRPAAPPVRNLKVRAIRLGYFDNERKRIGDVFLISSARHAATYPARGLDGKPHPKAGQKDPRAGELVEFSETWMELVGARVPEKTTSSQQALNRELHRVQVEKSGTGQGQGSDEAQENANVLGE